MPGAEAGESEYESNLVRTFGEWGTPTAGPLCAGPRPRARPPLPPSSDPRLPPPADPRARSSLAGHTS